VIFGRTIILLGEAKTAQGTQSKEKQTAGSTAHIRSTNGSRCISAVFED
jgi:hypothetical protein